VSVDNGRVQTVSIGTRLARSGQAGSLSYIAGATGARLSYSA